MSAAVGAALKKIAVDLLTSKKGLKLVGGILLGIIIIIITPIAALLAIFSGDLEIDTDALHQEVESIYQSEFQAIEDKTEEIKDAMIVAGYSARADEAQMIFLMVLYEKRDEDDLVERLVGCFTENQTDEELIATVNATFGVEISVEMFTNAMESIRAAYIDISGYTDPATKNNLDLVQWAVNAEQKGWGYVWGTYGQVLDDDMLRVMAERYPDEIGSENDYIEQNLLYKRTTDCSGLIKGYCWFDAVTGDIGYAVNGASDIDANGIYYDASERGEISTIPEIPGLAVWQEGHIGIYIGNGEVIEAMGTQYGVVKTQLADGNWTHWMKIPYITYVEQETGTDAETE